MRERGKEEEEEALLFLNYQYYELILFNFMPTMYDSLMIKMNRFSLYFTFFSFFFPFLLLLLAGVEKYLDEFSPLSLSLSNEKLIVLF